MTIKEIVPRGLLGDPQAISALQQMATYLGRGLIPVIYSVNPRGIVLGGAISEA